MLRDAHGVPQIYADNSTDLFFAQGYVQAQDRFFEMDFRRHVTAGRLSELFGRKTRRDRHVHPHHGLAPRRRRRSTTCSRPRRRPTSTPTATASTPTSRGSRRPQISLEYTVLGLSGLDYQPEKWTPVDSLAWLKAMAWDLRGNMDDEIARARLSVDRTPEQVAELYPRYPYDRHAPIMPTPASQRTGVRSTASGRRRGAELALEAVRRGVDSIPDLVGHGRRHRVEQLGRLRRAHRLGQAAAGQRPAPRREHAGRLVPDGPALPHGRPPTAPSTSPASPSPAFPGVVIGHNHDIAWGMTNLDPDVTDLYLEKVTGKTYLYDGRQLPLTERDEVIRIAGAASKLITVRSTRHGPLLSDVSAELSSVGANARGRRRARRTAATATPSRSRGPR